jgi:hypothetical protein
MEQHRHDDGKDAGLRKEITMNLIDRYVTAVGKNLPQKIRADIETEIRSTLEDMLDERSKSSGKPVDDEMIKEVLKQYGDPEKVAASYLPERYLIGPRLYPVFMLVLKIVLTVLTILTLVGLGISLGTSVTPQAFWRGLASSALDFGGGILQAFGNIVLVFAIVEWATRQSKEKDQQTTWNPDNLKYETNQNEIKKGDQIAAIVFSTIFLLLLNFYPDMIGISFTANRGWTFTPVLSDAFFSYMPYINTLMVLGIGMAVILLRQESWTITTRLLWIALKAAGIALAFIMLFGPSLIAIDPAALVSGTGMGTTEADTLVKLLSQMPRIALIITIILGGLDVIKTAYAMIFNKEPMVTVTQ